MYTPAVTMVAAWISADTGVGPSMASGSQTYSGNCADLPVAPKNSSSAIALSTPKPAISGVNWPLRSTALTSVNRTVPSTRQHQQHAEHEAGVADAIDDECLLARVARRLLVEVEADQQVAAQAHAFPADEQQRVVVRQHQHQHEEHEQIQVAEEAVVAVVVGHVAGGVDVDQEADAGDHQDHHGAERVEQEAPVGGEGGQLAVGHVERQAGEPGELDHLMHALGAAAKAASTAPAEKMNDSSTIPGQIRLIRNFSGEW